jgi:hypothetical protein
MATVHSGFAFPLPDDDYANTTTEKKTWNTRDLASELYHVATRLLETRPDGQLR